MLGLCSGIVLCCAFHPTQLLLATGGDDSQVRVWDLVAKSCIATLQGHFSAVTSLSTSPDGWHLLSGGRDGVVIAWSLRDFSKVATVPVYEAVEGVVAVPATMCLPSATTAKGSKAKAADKELGGTAGAPLCFATGGEKGVVKLWRADTAQCLWDGAVEGAGTPTASGAISELRALPGGAGFLAATQDCRLLFLESTQAAAGARLNLLRQLIGNNDEVTDLRFITAAETTSVEPTHIAVATNSEHIRLFDATTLSCTATLDGHTDTVIALDATRLKNGRSLLASGSKDASMRLWAAPEGRCIGLGGGHVGAVSAVAFSRRSRDFVVTGGSDKLLKVWDISALDLDGASPTALKATAAVAAHDKDINAVAVAPNDSVVATASQDRTAKIWKLPDLVLGVTLRGHKRGVWAVAFSPVDQAVATASGDKTVRLWALKDGACLRTFEGHLASVLRVDFLSAGTQLMTSGSDGLLKLWSVRTSECVNTFDGHEDKVWALALGGNDGALAASGGGDGGVVLWEDCTTADADVAALEAEETLLQEQDLSNAVHAKNWKKAAKLALEMGRPGQLLHVVSQVLDACAGDDASADKILSSVVGDLEPDRLKQCLQYCREWNTNSRTCAAAQVVLHSVLRAHPPAQLLQVPGVAPILEALVAYTQRHVARVDRLLCSTFVVDYVLGAMNVLTPGDEEESGAALKQLANGHAKAANGGVGDASSEEESEPSSLHAVDDEDEEVPEKKASVGKKRQQGKGSALDVKQSSGGAPSKRRPTEKVTGSAVKKTRRRGSGKA